MAEQRDESAQDMIKRLQAFERRLRVAGGDLRALGLPVVEVSVVNGEVRRRVISTGNSQTN